MPRLAELIGTHSQEIRRRFQLEAARHAAAGDTTRVELAEHLPAILSDLASLCDAEPTRPAAADLVRLSGAHQAVELRRGFDLSETVAEYLILARVIAEVLGGLPEESRPASDELVHLLFGVGTLCTATIDVFSGRVRSGIVAERRLMRSLESLVAGDGPLESTGWLPSALGVLLESLDVPAGAVFLFDDGSGRLRLAAARGLAAPEALGEAALVDLVAETDAVQTLSATGPEAPVTRAMRAIRMTDGLGTRLRSRGNFTGVLYVATPRQRTFGFLDTRRFARFAGEVAHLVALARADTARLALADRVEGEVRLRQALGGGLLHDLAGHLGAIRLTAEAVAKRPGDPDRVRGLAEGIVESVDLADRQLQDGRLADRIAAGERLPIHPTPLDVGVLVRKLVGDGDRPHAPGIGIDVEGEVESEVDPDLLGRAIRHLVDNAVRHGPRGEPVTVTVRGEGDTVSIAVHDLGRGSAPELEGVLPSLGERAPRRASGLGLLLAQGCAAAHDGELRVEGSDGAGTTFTLRLPRRAPAPS